MLIRQVLRKTEKLKERTTKKDNETTNLSVDYFSL